MNERRSRWRLHFRKTRSAHLFLCSRAFRGLGLPFLQFFHTTSRPKQPSEAVAPSSIHSFRPPQSLTSSSRWWWLDKLKRFLFNNSMCLHCVYFTGFQIRFRAVWIPPVLFDWRDFELILYYADCLINRRAYRHRRGPAPGLVHCISQGRNRIVCWLNNELRRLADQRAAVCVWFPARPDQYLWLRHVLCGPPCVCTAPMS